ncbi:MAG: protein kinase, partial [Planctomycetota bacterium]
MREALGAERPAEGAPAPKTFGRFRNLREAGRGAMGTVYQAQDPFLDRRIALKVLDPSLLATEDGRDRFFQEGRLAASLRHPLIVAVHEAGIEENQPYLVMDYIEGESLASILERERLSPHKAAAWTKEIAEALAYAHAQGVIHRDVKPGNVRIDKTEHAILMDFGLAREVKGEAGLTRSGMAVGTPAYMAPEQVEGRSLDGRADVYGAGAALYEMLTGAPPFLEPTIMATLRAVLDREPVPPRRIRPKIPEDLETICLQALEKDANHRYPTPQALASDLDAFLSGEPIRAKRPGLIARGLPAILRNPLRAGIIAGAICGCTALAFLDPLLGGAAWAALVLGFAASLAIWSRREARRRAREAAGLLERLTQKEEEEKGGWVVAIDDDFQRELLGEAWKPIRGKWRVQGGELVGNAEEWGAILCRERISGDVRAEMEVTIDPGAEPHDLSLFVNGAYLERAGRIVGYQAIFGAAGNTGTILRREGQNISFSPAAGLQAGQRYRIALERVEDRIRFLVDGQEVLRFVDLFPIRGPDRYGLGIYLYRTTLRIHRFRAFRMRVPKKISILDAADDFFLEGHSSEARSRYRSIQESYPDTELGRMAHFKEALCLHQEGRLEEAREALETVAAKNDQDQVGVLARIHMARTLVELGRIEEAIGEIEGVRARVLAGSSAEALLETFFAERGESLMSRGRLSEARQLFEADQRL